ncbi:MAG: hypothetical protein PUI46_03805 [Lachnospiraceae bacterium]|nr:hypothetical protein [Lachnospiraceae bacterium]MDY5701821.1 hypothetical protein [Lachnospiraceae bacterium]
MNLLSTMTTTDWFILILVVIIIGAAFWLVNDTRKRGANVGGKLCGGCPHYCQMNRNCDGTPKEQNTASDEQA